MENKTTNIVKVYEAYTDQKLGFSRSEYSENLSDASVAAMFEIDINQTGKQKHDDHVYSMRCVENGELMLHAEHIIDNTEWVDKELKHERYDGWNHACADVPYYRDLRATLASMLPSEMPEEALIDRDESKIIPEEH